MSPSFNIVSCYSLFCLLTSTLCCLYKITRKCFSGIIEMFNILKWWLAAFFGNESVVSKEHHFKYTSRKSGQKHSQNTYILIITLPLLSFVLWPNCIEQNFIAACLGWFIAHAYNSYICIPENLLFIIIFSFQFI